MEYSELCRSCMKELHENDLEEYDQNLMNMFLFCTNIQAAEVDELPKQFCSECIHQINTSYKYIKNAQENNETLKKIILERQSFKFDDIDNNNDHLNFDDKSEVKFKVKYEDFEGSLHTEEYIEDISLDNTSMTQENIQKLDDKIFVAGELNGERGIDSQDNEDSCQANIIGTSTIKLKTEISEKLTENISLKTTNSDGKLSCPLCKKTYLNGKCFQNHLRRKHNASQPLYALDDKKVENTDSKQYICPFCPTICESYASLRYHKNQHAEDRRFACNACGKRFRQRKGLSVHALTHSTERPFICDCCHMSFKLKHVLVKHMAMHKNDRPYLCHICAKGFKSESNLRLHLPRHSVERGHACAQCAFRSAHRSSLRRHVRAHAGARPHACAHCRKAFCDTQKLKRHMRIHTGEKPYRCPNCPLAFIDHWKRKMHIMRVHQVPFEEIPRLDPNGQPA